MSLPPKNLHCNPDTTSHLRQSEDHNDYSRNVTRPPSLPNQHYSVDPLHTQAARIDGRPTGTHVSSRHRPSSTLGFGEPPAVSPEHAQARAETFQRILRSSPRAAQPELAINFRDTGCSVSTEYVSQQVTSQGSHHHPAGQSSHYSAPHGWRRTNRDTMPTLAQPPSSSPRTLSVFNAPTATFMWPGFQASSQMNTAPKIYVNYNRNRPSSPDRDPTDDTHPEVPPSSVRAFPEEPTTSIPQKRRPSRDLPPPEPTSVSTILEPFKRIHIADRQRLDSAEPHPRRHGKGPFHVEPQPRPQSASGSRDFSAPREDELRATPEETYGDEPEQVPPQVAPTIITSSSKSEEEWESFARLIKLPDGTSKWQCHWRTMDDGVEVNCGYLSKKQLVKRHVETTHLKYRPFVCDVCGKKFPQKTSLDTHMHGHTGATPHQCRFSDCDLSFKDPARRHRHMVDEHGYVPRQSQRRHRSGQGPSESSEFESMTPWAVAEE